jgi:hypothetical protein
VDWVVHFIRIHRMRSRDDLFPADPKIEVFLTHLAAQGNVAPATRNQVMNTLVFLYKRALRQSMEGLINAVRAGKKVSVPAERIRVIAARGRRKKSSRTEPLRTKGSEGMVTMRWDMEI